MERTKILYIEDDLRQRQEFSKLLQKKNYKVLAAQSGKEGLSLFAQNDVDILLCDLNLPDMDGLDILNHVKKINPLIPVILLTAHGSIPLAVDAIKKGADHFVLKPLEINEIDITIRHAVENVQLLKKLKSSEDTLRMIMETMPDILYSLNPEGKFTSLSLGVESILGYTQLELLGRSVFDIIHPDDRDRIKTGLTHAIKTCESQSKSIEFRMICKSGEIKDFEIRRRLYFENGKMIRNIGIALDITERKKSEIEKLKYSQLLEKRVEERTKRLANANRQLAALNEAANKFSRIFDEDTLFDQVPSLLTSSLDFDRAALILKKDDTFSLRSYHFEKDSPKVIEEYLSLLNKKTIQPPVHLLDSIKKNKTIFIQDIDKDPHFPKELTQTIPIKSLVAAPITVKGKIIGFIEGDMQYHEKEMDAQDVARVEMFANMVGLALDNIRSYQNLEKTVDERTHSLQFANDSLNEKAKELEHANYQMAHANVALLSIQEQLEEKNAEMQRLIYEISQSKDELQAILDSSYSVIVMVNPSGKITAVNKETSNFFGLTSEDLLDQPFQTFLSKITNSFQNHEHFEKIVQELTEKTDAESSKHLSVEKIYERSCLLLKPTPRYLSIFTTPVQDTKNKVTLGRVWTFVDITKMKEADEQLRAIVKVSPIPFVISRISDGHILFANEPLASLLGLETHKLVGQYTPDYYADPNDRQYVVKQVQKHGFLYNHEVKIKKADGRIFWMIMSIVKTEINSEPVLIGALYDINERRKAEEELKKERNFVSAILDTAGALVVVLDPQGRFVRFNRTCEKITGKTFDKVKGKKVWDLFIIPEEIEFVKAAFTKLKAGRTPGTAENYWIAYDGSRRLITWSNSTLYDENGQVEYIIATGIDITERKEAEDKLRLYREVFLNSKDGILILDNQGQLQARNPAHREFSGYSDDEMIGKPISQFMDPAFGEEIEKALTSGDSYRGEAIAFNKANEKKHIDLSVFSIYNDKGYLQCYVGIARDIEERKKAEEALRRAHDELEIRVQERTAELATLNKSLREEIAERQQIEIALRESEAKNRALLNAIPDLMFRINKKGIYLDYQAPKWSELEVPKETVIGKNINETMPPNIARKAKTAINKALASNETQVLEYQLPHEGLIHDFEARIVVSGKDEVMTIVRDITEQKQAREALQKAHDELEIRVQERTAEIVQVNDTLREEIKDRIEAEQKLATRLRYEEGLANCIQALLTGVDINTTIPAALKELKKAATVGRVYIFENFEDETEGLCTRLAYEVCDQHVISKIKSHESHYIPYKKGYQRWAKQLSQGKSISGPTSKFPENERVHLESEGILSMLILPLWVDSKWYGFIGFDDIKVKREWGDQDIQLLKTAAEMLGGYIAKIKSDKALRFSEQRFRSLVENAHDIIYSMKPDGTFSYLSPQFFEYTGYNVQEFLGKSFEPLLHPDDKAETLGSAQTDPTRYVGFLHGREFRLKQKNGGWRWIITHSTNIRDDNKKTIERIGVAHDITDMKNVLQNLEMTNKELRETQAQLVQSEKMAALGNLVAGVAHEINTPLGAVYSMHNTLMRAIFKLKSSLPTTETIKDPQNILQTLKIIDDANEVIKSGTERVTNIVRKLRRFARLDEADFQKADIHEGLDTTLTLVHHELKNKVNVIKQYGNIPQINCYPNQLNQVFLNIFVNAAHAIKEKGELEITTTSDKNNVYIDISDTGIGIPQEHLNKIFDPGFTTKGVGVGTGLGLSISYNIIKKHNGEIKAKSIVGKGTTLTIILPIKQNLL